MNFIMGKHVGRFFFGSVSFVRTKEMNSPVKGENISKDLAQK
ncbi:MAG: hypothetical protein ACN4GR_10140 [Arenicellales bacterium]